MQELTPEQKLRQTRRFHLEEMEWTTIRYLSDLKKECQSSEHVVIRGWIRWSPKQNKIVETQGDSASCCLCGVDLGWWCPKNPKGYCEYEPFPSNHYGCKFCGQPDERK